MAVLINQTENEFHLQTKNTSYIFSIMKDRQLGHLYYGKRIRQRDSFAHMFKKQPTPSAVCEFQDDSEFALVAIKQEYPSYGKGDFRQPAYQILQENGSRITEFRFKSFKVYKGKNKLAGLPATYVENENEAETLEITLFDELLNTELVLSYSVFEELDAITRSVKIKNNGTKKLNIKRLMSMSVDMFDRDYDMIQLSGAWARERHMYRNPLRIGVQSIESTRGTSSQEQNPFIALARKTTDEFQGDVFGFSLVYSGNFLAQVEVDHYDVARVIMGINPFEFNWLLESGEEFQSPEAVMVYSDKGLNGMSNIYHNLYRTRLAKGVWRDKVRPVLINNWEATYFSFTEDKIEAIADEAVKLGVELFVLDDGWFGRRDSDQSSLGDWFVHEDKLPNGVKGIADKIVAKGLQFGLWFEPEMISEKSELYKAHREWMIQVPNRKLSTGRNQFVLDFSNKDCVDYIHAMVSKVLREAPISYVKWDMNRNMSEVGSTWLPAERQSETAHRYILGVYDLYERLTTEFPEILFESCAGGGGRFDPGMLHYAPQAWTSDDSDAVERLHIQYGTSLLYPISSMGAHVSEVPNHQVSRLTSLETRTNVAYFGAFGYELDATKMSDKDKQTVKDHIKYFKTNRELFQFGDFIRLKSPEEGNITSWMTVSTDKKEAILGYYKVLNRPNQGFSKICLKGLDEDMEYVAKQIKGNEEIELGRYYGDELMNAGYVFNPGENDLSAAQHSSKDFSSKLLKFTAL